MRPHGRRAERVSSNALLAGAPTTNVEVDPGLLRTESFPAHGQLRRKL